MYGNNSVPGDLSQSPQYVGPHHVFSACVVRHVSAYKAAPFLELSTGSEREGGVDVRTLADEYGRHGSTGLQVGRVDELN